MNAVEKRYAGTASGINNAASRVAALLAVALFGIVMTPVFNAELDRALTRRNLPPPVVTMIVQQRDRLAAIELPATLGPEARSAAQRAIGEAFVAGFRWIMAMSALLCFASAAVAWLLIGRAGPSRAPPVRGA